MFTHNKLLAGILALAALTGCARLGERMERGALPPGAPTEQEVLSDLAANDARIQSISNANATLTMKSPRLKATQVVSADIKFLRPDRLRIVGRQRAFRTEVFRITSVGSEFVVDIPSEGEPTYRHAGETIQGVPFTVSPSDIARELFLPEDWSQLRKSDVRVTAYDAATGHATLEVGPEGHPWRRITVAGPPWRLTASERLDEQGRVMARTTLSDYREYEGGIQFPENIAALFPNEETELILTNFNKPRFNTIQEESDFAIDWRQYEVRTN